MAEGSYLSTGKAAKLLSVTPDTVLKWIHGGKLPATQTAGGHFRIARQDVESLLFDSGPPSVTGTESSLLYCWEYFSHGGAIGEQCEACLVYKARALRCHEMSALPRESGFSGSNCKTTCAECAYYRRVTSEPRRVLVVTDSVRLRDRLRGESATCHLLLEFASCEYECSAAVERFRPEYVVIDCGLSGEVCTELCSHLAADSRIPGVQVILAAAGIGHDEQRVGNQQLEQLRRSFSVAELERLILGEEGAGKEVITAGTA